MKKYPIALIVGRFQPFHNGHLFLLKKALLIAEKVIFGIGSASIYDENNPLSYEERKIMIETVVKNERISNRVIKIVPLEDFYDDKKWLNNLREKVGKFDIAMGNNEWTNKILKKAGYKVIKVDYYKRHIYEGWRIRKLIKYPIIKFNHVILGGTFDHFHKGHKALLKKAFELGKKITIGIATEKLYKDKLLSEAIEPLEIRKKNLKKYINKKIQDDRTITNYKIIPISDIYGSAGNDRKFDAIIVSKETYPNALIINKLREKNKLLLLRIVIVDDVLADDGKLIGSERIRIGEIGRDGQVYLNFFKKTLILSESFKEELRKPIGEVYKEVCKVIKSIKSVKPVMVMAVGDIIAMELEKEGFIPDIKIIDYRSRRKELAHNNAINKDCLYQRQSLLNKSGTINIKAAKKIYLTIKKFLTTKKPQTIIVDGEEDLLALPSILLAPLNSLVLYGHWMYGIIAVVADEATKIKIASLIKKFDTL